VADLTLLVVLATVGGATGLRLDPRLALLGSGLALTFVTDVAYLLANLHGSYREGEPLDLGWLLALLPIAAAATLRGPNPRPHGTLRTASIQRAAVAAPTAAALAALAVLVIGYYVALPPAAGALAAAALLVALVRACLTLQQLKGLPEARRQARTDPLTELANRRHLHERCARLLTHQDAAPVSLLMIDLDGFKVINDRHGHPVGDALLVEVATRLAATMRRDDLLGRLGGDEFAAILPRTTPLQARAVAQRMHTALAGPMVVAGHVIRIDASVGVSAAGRPGTHSATLFREADTAMYRAKRSRTGTAIAATALA
jgi:diguanylate cyclase (GGDEF)-like protein